MSNPGRAPSPLAAGPRPRRASRSSAALTFAWRGLLKVRHVPEELGDAVGIPLIFTVLFTYLFGGALTGSTDDYLQFLLPGTLVIAVVFVTVYSGVNLNSDLSTGAFDRYRSLPIWRAAPIAGGLVGDCARYVLAAVLVVLLGLVMGFDPAGGLLGTVAAIALVVAFSLALSLAWVIVGLLARTPRAVMTLGFMILFPVTFVSNVFVDPATMPALLRSVADANPVSHLVTAARGLMEGTATTGQVAWVLIATAALALVLMPLAARLYRTRDARPR